MRFVVIGGLALGSWGVVRGTKDCDIVPDTVRIPILSSEHLTVCKVVFDRPKDWLDVEEMIAWGTAIDAGEALGWVREILGETSEQYARLATLSEQADAA